MNISDLKGKRKTLQHLYQCVLGMVTFTAILFLALVKTLLKNWLVDLSSSRKKSRN